MSDVFEPCASCGAKCCINYRVVLTDFDVKRIVKSESIAPEVFCELVREEEVKHEEKAVIFLSDGKDKINSYVLCLKRRRNGHCVFLGKEGKCLLYGARPTVCRCYPFEVGEKGELTKVKNYSCPREWKEEEMGTGEYLEVWKRREKETDEFAKKVREWNAKYGRKERRWGKALEFLCEGC
ncbi:hypothetical protein AUJ17_03360 [Candidatus Micrarchaeota archaeon CG1_02_47_40]|nr:MAG: hypothetical protein AUJ17_03360 [Candidatus Micrarchaeota archaeon CG1_02_47_40]